MFVIQVCQQLVPLFCVEMPPLKKLRRLILYMALTQTETRGHGVLRETIRRGDPA